MLTDAEKRRYKRHIMLPELNEEGQEKLKSAKILIIGAGGLGAPVLQYLTASGVGTIGIMDDDVVSEDNLQRQILYGGHDLGKLKTIIARERLNVLNPMVRHEILNIRLKPSNALEIISQFDVIVDATDNYSSRYLINDACILAEKPWVFGSIYKFEGQISTFVVNDCPSLRCIFPDVVDKKNIPDPSETGVLGILPGIIGSLQANEVLKLILGIGELLCGKLLIYNMLTNNFTSISFKKNPDSFNITALRKNY